MKPETTKQTFLSGTIVLAAVIFAGASLVTFMANPSIYAGLALVPAGYGVYAFIKKYYQKSNY